MQSPSSSTTPDRSSPASSSRRRFLQTAVAAAATSFAAPAILRGAGSPNAKLQHASFGSNGMAFGDLSQLAGHPDVELVAVADVDMAQTEKLKAKFPDCRIYQDYRELLETEGDKIDCCNVSTPDHMHAPIAMSAMQRGKHVYCQKPLTHDIYESRQLRLVAAEKGIVSQMGTQLASSTPDMTVEAWIAAGAIGKVKEVHTFSHKTWGDTNPLPERVDAVPETLDWELWNGVLTPVPYIKGAYHPKNWRKRLAYGTGTLGDMGCHMFNGWFRALRLDAPLRIRSNGPAPNATNWALDAEVHYTFPGNELTAGDMVDVIWYDGANRPPQKIVALLGEDFPKQGSVYVGEDGYLVHPHGGTLQLLPADKYANHSHEEIKGSSTDHWKEFIDAILGQNDGRPPKSQFDFAGPMTETVLLGNVAAFFPGETLEWNASDMVFPNKPEANQHVRKSYRDGWVVKGLS